MISPLMVKTGLLPIKRTGRFCGRFRTNDHVQSIRTVLEKSIKFHRPLILAFVDLYKAFDTINLDAVLALDASRIDYRYAKLIYNVYKNASKVVEQHESTKPIRIGRGVQQGNTMSMCLLSFWNTLSKCLIGKSRAFIQFNSFCIWTKSNKHAFCRRDSCKRRQHK